MTQFVDLRIRVGGFTHFQVKCG